MHNSIEARNPLQGTVFVLHYPHINSDFKASPITEASFQKIKDIVELILLQKDEKQKQTFVLWFHMYMILRNIIPQIMYLTLLIYLGYLKESSHHVKKKLNLTFLQKWVECLQYKPPAPCCHQINVCSVKIWIRRNKKRH